MDGDARLVQAEQHRFGLHALDAQADDVGHPVDRVAAHGHPGRPPRPPRPDRSVWRRAASLRRRAAPARPELGRGGPEADGRQHVLQPGPAGPLLLAADQERLEPQAPADDQRADAGRAAQLVGGDRHQVGAEPLEVEGTCPAAATASTWTGMPRRRQRSTTSATGWTVPTSWLAHWQWTRAGGRPWWVRHRSMAACDRVHGSMRPGAVDGDGDHRARPGPRRRGPPSAPPRRRPPAPGRLRVAPHTAALMASVPPEVNTT